MEIIYIFFGIMILVFIGIFVRLGSILLQLQSNQEINSAYNDDHHNQRGELLQRQNDILEQLADDVQQLQTDVRDMKYVSDVFYKYKLPDEKEREMLEQIEIDNEVFDGISGARKST